MGYARIHHRSFLFKAPPGNQDGRKSHWTPDAKLLRSILNPWIVSEQVLSKAAGVKEVAGTLLIQIIALIVNFSIKIGYRLRSGRRGS